eukprot:512679_1
MSALNQIRIGLGLVDDTEAKVDQLTLHVRNCRVIKTQPSELKDITSFLKRMENSSQSGTLILKGGMGWMKWFNQESAYHAILAKDEAKLYLFPNNTNSVENQCKKTILLRGAFLRKRESKEMIIRTVNETRHFIAPNRKERDIWFVQIAESIQKAQQTDYRRTQLAAYRNTCLFVNSQKILIIDDNKEQGVIDDDIHQVRCVIEVSGNAEDKQILILVRMSCDRTLQCITEYVSNFLTTEYAPMCFSLIAVSDKSCTNRTIYAMPGIDNLNIQMNTFDADDIENKGLYFIVKSIYYHAVQTPITCPYMIEHVEENHQPSWHCQSCDFDNVDNNTNTCTRCHSFEEQKLDPMTCPIYHMMFENKEFNSTYLAHIEDETHYKDEFKEKPLCPHDQNCQVFRETEHGIPRTDYKCHMALYRHPPANIKVSQNSNLKEFIMNSSKNQNVPLYVPTEREFKQRDDEIGFYHHLLREVKNNGFEEDLWKQNDGRYYRNHCGAKNEIKATHIDGESVNSRSDVGIGIDDWKREMLCRYWIPTSQWELCQMEMV